MSATHDTRASSARTTTSTPRSRVGCPRRRGRRTTFPEILELVWWRVDRALDLEMIALVGDARRARGARSGHDRDRRPPLEPERDRGQPRRDRARRAPRSACACVCCYEVTDRNGADGAKAGPGRERAVPARRRARAASARTRAFTLSDETLDAVCGLAADLGVGVHVHVAEDPVDAAAGARLAGRGRRRLDPRARGAPRTARCRAPSCTTRGRTSTTRSATARPARFHARRARHRRHRRRHARGVPARVRARPRRRRHHVARRRRGRGSRPAPSSCPRSRDDRVTWSYDADGAVAPRVHARRAPAARRGRRRDRARRARPDPRRRRPRSAPGPRSRPRACSARMEEL